MRTKTIDLLDIVEEYESEKIVEIEDLQDEILELAEEEYGEYMEVPSKIEGKWETLEEQKGEIRGQVEMVREELVDWTETYSLEELSTEDGYEWGEVEWDRVPSQFTISQLNAATFAEIEDKVSEQSYEMDFQAQKVEGVPKSGYGRILTCEKSIVNAPEGSPHFPDSHAERAKQGAPRPGEYGSTTLQLIYEEINDYTTYGDADVGNSSFREAMGSRSDEHSATD